MYADNQGCYVYSLAYKSTVAFGNLNSLNTIDIWFHVNSMQNKGTTLVCQLLGCTTCITHISADEGTIILSADTLYSVAKGTVVASAVFIDSLTQSRDYSLALMFDPQAEHSFVYYAVSVDFVGNYLEQLHSNDNNIITVTVLANNTEIRIASTKDVKINGTYYFSREDITFILDVGETLMVSSYDDLTGCRVTANRSILFYSGHYCASGKTTNCSIINEQIPPYNSWGNTFIMHTNISGLKGNIFKVLASDIGANVFINCTNDGTDYETKDFNLGFREHRVLYISHDYCYVKSDKNILIIQFRDSSPPLMDTFMTIIPALVHYEDSYVLNAQEGFNNYIAITVKDTNGINDYILLNDGLVAVKWKTIELDANKYYFSTLLLTPGRHKVTFNESSSAFGVVLYGSNGDDTFAHPGGMKLNVVENMTNTGL